MALAGREASSSDGGGGFRFLLFTDAFRAFGVDFMGFSSPNDSRRALLAFERNSDS